MARCALVLCGLVVVLLGPAPAQAASSVYVVNQFSANVSLYDIGAAGALAPKASAMIGLRAGQLPYPTAVAASPDGKSVYVTNGSSESISQYDVGTNGLIALKARAAIATESFPAALAVSPDGKSVYVANQASDSVSQYDVGPNGALKPKASPTIAGGSAPSAVAVSPDGKSVYVTNETGDDVSQYDVGAGGALKPKARARIPAGRAPAGLAVTPDSENVYVINKGGANVSLYDVRGEAGLAPKVRSTISAGEGSTELTAGVAVSPDGRSVYVTNGHSDDVSQYDVGAGGTLEHKSRATIRAGEEPVAVAVSRDGKSVYVTSAGSDAVSQYDVGAGGALKPKAAATISAGDEPVAVAVSPDQGPLRCVAPRLKGRTLAAARRTVRRAHCTLGTSNRRRSQRVRKGRVIAQRPAPGNVSAAGAEVTITLSSGR